MDIKFYNTYLPIVSQDLEAVIPVTNSDLNISFKVEINHDFFKIHNYSCSLVCENIYVKELNDNIPQSFNILLSYLRNRVGKVDDLCCLYILSLLQAVGMRKYVKDLQTDTIHTMQNKNLGLSFLSGSVYVKRDKYIIQEGLLALPNHFTGVDVCSKVILFNEDKSQEKYFEKVLTYNNQNIIICDSLELNDFYLNKQHLCCDEVICL
ncbi:hypothetical protein [Fluviispira sanaruensis]|uniref:Uncharacterized protein n=1 Tax=Fluviispira sanaruensis TaxID=2493639 RepID=A0A4P2VLM8_FLUSA|nr:hypothetical protein [Fluviispira sanaruensis]BBH54246.1 hypothetical protein JCM31447_27060 [Fluviispira sanaruensis]